MRCFVCNIEVVFNVGDRRFITHLIWADNMEHAIDVIKHILERGISEYVKSADCHYVSELGNG